MARDLLARPRRSGAPTSFGALLRAERARIGASQSDVARWAGLDASYLSKLEAGEREPSSAAVDALAGALDLAPGVWVVWRVAAGYAPPGLAVELAPASVSGSTAASTAESTPARGEGVRGALASPRPPHAGAPAGARIVARPLELSEAIDARYGDRRADVARAHERRLARDGYVPQPERADETGARWQVWTRGGRAVLLLLR